MELISFDQMQKEATWLRHELVKHREVCPEYFDAQIDVIDAFVAHRTPLTTRSLMVRKLDADVVVAILARLQWDADNESHWLASRQLLKWKSQLVRDAKRRSRR
jgi:hypothetical protein